MAKNTFINKKFLIIVLFLIIAVAGGVGLYFLLKPKPDLKAPYNNTYQLTTNDDYNYVLSYNQKILDYFVDYLDLDNEEIANSQDKYLILNDMLSVYDSINNQLLNNLLFTKDYDGKMVDPQRSMSDSYQKVLSNVEICKDYLNTYLTLDKVENYPTNEHIWQMINNYNSLYFDFLNELSNFYYYAGEIFENYLINTIEVNDLTKQNITTTVLWAKEIIFKTTSSEANVLNLSISSENLRLFVSRNNGLKRDEYFVNKTYYDNLLKCFKNISLEDCIKNLTDDTYQQFVEGQTSQEKMEFATTLGKMYFLVLE